LIVAAAVMHGLSLPKWPLFFLAFVFLVPLLHLVKDGKVKKTFLVFFSFSFISHVIVLYWIPNVMVRYGGMSEAVGIIGIIILAAFLALFTGLAGLLIKHAPLYAAPVIWIAKDLLIEKILGGFPWCLTGYSQYQNIYFIQLAEWGGIHLITFLLIAFNVLLYAAVIRKDKHAGAAAAIILIAVYTTGFYLYKTSQNNTAGIAVHKAGIIQPNTHNDLISYAEKNAILSRLFKESTRLAEAGAEFIIWPEHSVSLYPMQQESHRAPFIAFARTHVPIMAGFTDRQSFKKIYNSYLLFDGNSVQKYDKVHLAPFGEYVLFREYLFFVRRIVSEIADFSSGDGAHNLTVNGHKVATPICYEVIYPELVKDFTTNGAQLLITGSNDSWFGNTSAKYQHLAMALFRSIENRRYILRSTTNGISGVIAPSGEIIYSSPHAQQDYVIGEFKYLNQTTIYMSRGYLFPYLCTLLMLLYFCIAGFKKFKPKKKPEQTS